MQKYEPIAVMTTSRFKWTNQWMLEIGAKNLARSGWSLLSWNEDRPPYIGGSDIDPAKLWGPNAGHGPRADNPPDATRAADPVADNKVGREITDAVYDIQTEILARLTGEFAQADLKAETNTKFQGVDDKDRYVSAFAGYHALWYDDWKESCKAAWHTHVGYKITRENASKAIRLQLQELIKWLNAH